MTPKQSRFSEEYLIDLNATQAAIRAGYSEKTADVKAAQLMALPDIRAAIDDAIEARSQQTGIDAAFVLNRLVEEAEADLADLFDANGDLKPVADWPLIWRTGLVASVDVDALYEGSGEDRKQIGQVKKLRLSDRLKRVELIGKHVAVNAFQETVRIDALDGLAERLARARNRREIDAQARVIDTVPMVATPPSASPAAPEPPIRPSPPPATPPTAMQRPPPRAEYTPILPAPRPVAYRGDYASSWPEEIGRVKTNYDPFKP